jgi:hypothetical protein
MTAVAGQWTGAYAINSGFYFPYPSARPVQIAIGNTPGDWLFAIVAWRPSTAGSGVSIVVADDAHNWWEPVGAPSADSGAAGTVRTAVWAAPAARVANSGTGVTNVQVAATGPVLSLAATIVDFNGLLPWYQVAAIGTNYANAATALSLSAAAPSASALLFAGFASDSNSDTVTGPSGWTALTGSSASNGVDHTADIRLTPAYQVTSASTAASVSSSGTLDLAGVIAGVLVGAPQPAQPNPYWPVMITEAAIGSGVQTPPSEMTWTPLSGRSLAFTMKQGKSYSLGQLQAGQGTLTLDNPDGALIPPGTGAYAGIDSGTPLRRRVIWPGVPGGAPNPAPNYVAFSGYFRRWPWNLSGNLLRGQAVAEIADIWAYGVGTLNSMAIEECLLDSPHSLWPLTDPAGSTVASNLVPNGLGLTQVTSKYGAAGATAVFGSGSGDLLGASSAETTSSGTSSGGGTGMWEQTLAGQSFAQNFYGYALVCTDSSYPPISSGVTVETFAGYEGTYTILGAVAFTVPAATGATFTATASIPAGAPVIFSTAVGFTFPTGITAGQVYYVLGDGGTSFQVSASYGGSPVNITVAGEGYIQVQIGWDPVIVSARDGVGPVAELDVRNTDGALLLRYRTAPGSPATTVTAIDTGHDYRGQGLCHFSLAVTQTTWRVLVNGGGVLTASGTFANALPASFRELDFGGIQDATEHGYAFPGLIGFAAVYPGVSPQIRVISRFTAASDGMQAEAACDRIERILEYGGLTARRWLGQQVIPEEGDLVTSGQDIGGQASVSSMNNIAASTLPAILYVAPSGDVVYRSKFYVWNEPVKWVLGDNTAGGEIPFLIEQSATDYDPTRVTADVQLTQLDTQSITLPNGVMSSTTMAAVAATAAGQYGGQPYQQTGYLTADWSSAYTAGGSLQDLANWVQAVYCKPQNRFQTVTVDAASHPAAWPFWAAAAVGDMATVNVRLPTAAVSPLWSLNARITQTDRSSQFSQDGASAKITVTLDFAPEYQALICDDPVRGLLNGSNLLSW